MIPGKNAEHDLEWSEASPADKRVFELWRRWSRLALAAFWTVVAATLFLVVPRLSSGATGDDYSSKVIFALILTVAAGALAVLALSLRAMLRQKKRAELTVSSMHTSVNDMRGRSLFMDRLALECEAAVRSNGAFAFILIRLNPPDGADQHDLLNRAVDAIRASLKDEDSCAPLSAQEIGVVLQDLSPRLAPQRAAQLADHVESALSTLAVEAQSGWAHFAPETSNAGSLIAEARAMIQRALTERIAEPA